ncbi:MAG TPA: neutral zinc metallopeptidase [Candidatus Limnocylindrales bacterium]|nr:neutral zinc metallopeptidase [Candidatus Limnocylindrales bacterium]
MDWRRSRQSENVVTGGAARLGGGVGLGGVAIVVLVGLVMGRSPLEILGQLVNMNGGGQYESGEDVRPTTPEQGEQVQFVRAILGSTEDTWEEVFSAAGKSYPAPRLVLFGGAVESACGRASAAVGPFYCPNDAQVYLDLQFFRDMEQRFHAAGDLARAYVIAHEVGHHLQNVLGGMSAVDRARQRGASMEGAEGLSVRLELQADCFAGVWANRSEERLHWLEPGDVESALAAATAIGDDALQRQAQGYVVPDSFTHGTSQQRVRWFKAGLKSGDIANCDTFKADQL